MTIVGMKIDIVKLDFIGIRSAHFRRMTYYALNIYRINFENNRL